MSYHQMDADDMDDLHHEIVDIMLEGRTDGQPWGYATPRYLAERTGESRQLVSNRLRDLEFGDAVEKVVRGLYRLNPEEVPTDEGEENSQ